MAEETDQQTRVERPTTDGPAAWKAYWQAQGMPWRTEQEISADRQAYLAERRAIEPDVEQGKYPFKDVGPKLARADIEWLLATHDNGRGPVLWEEEKNKSENERRVGLDLRGADLDGAHLQGLPLACLIGGLVFGEWINAPLEQQDAAAVRLNHAEMRFVQLEGAILPSAHMAGARLNGADLEDALLADAHLEGAALSAADLTNAHLIGAQLAHADLSQTQLQGAALFDAEMAQSNLDQACLEGADLTFARLDGANLRAASCDRSTKLSDVILTGACLAQAKLDATDLTEVDWKLVPRLGDEIQARKKHDVEGSDKTRAQHIEDYQAAARAYRRLAVALQANGMSEEASGYLYRAQIMQRRLQWHSLQPGAYLFSVLLAVLAGYGYRLWRIAATYLIVVAAFALAYLGSGVLVGGSLGGQQLADAAQISLNAIHGRVFFAQFHLDTLQSWLATIESVLGIVIEGVFVAMLIQRFFGK